MYSPTHPTAGQAGGGGGGGHLGGLLFVQAPGLWGISQVLSPGEITGLFDIENHLDFSWNLVSRPVKIPVCSKRSVF